MTMGRTNAHTEAPCDVVIENTDEIRGSGAAAAMSCRLMRMSGRANAGFAGV